MSDWFGGGSPGVPLQSCCPLHEPTSDLPLGAGLGLEAFRGFGGLRV